MGYTSDSMCISYTKNIYANLQIQKNTEYGEGQGQGIGNMQLGIIKSVIRMGMNCLYRVL